MPAASVTLNRPALPYFERLCYVLSRQAVHSTRIALSDLLLMIVLKVVEYVGEVVDVFHRDCSSMHNLHAKQSCLASSHQIACWSGSSCSKAVCWLHTAHCQLICSCVVVCMRTPLGRPFQGWWDCLRWYTFGQWAALPLAVVLAVSSALLLLAVLRLVPCCLSMVMWSCVNIRYMCHRHGLKLTCSRTVTLMISQLWAIAQANYSAHWWILL
jgi:hypothetical protein